MGAGQVVSGAGGQEEVVLRPWDGRKGLTQGWGSSDSMTALFKSGYLPLLAKVIGKNK